jgi:WD40 repeat protein
MPAKADPTKTRVIFEHKHGKPLIACRFDPQGRFVFFGSEDFRVWRLDWHADPKTITETEYNGHDSWVRAIGFSTDGQTLITGGYDGRLIWWPVDAEKPEPVRTVDAHRGWIRALDVSPDGKLVATVGDDLLVKIWGVDSGSLVHEMAGHTRYPYNVAFHPNGQDLVSGDLMGLLVHWEVASGKKVREFKAESFTKYDKTFKADIGGFRGLTFSPDGKTLAGSSITNVSNAFAGVGNPAVVVFDWESAKQIIQHESKAKLRGVAWNVAIHPDNFTIGISGGGGGGFLLFWKPGQKEEFHQFKLPNTARDLDLCHDGLHLATAHHDGRIRVSKMG